MFTAGADVLCCNEGNRLRFLLEDTIIYLIPKD